MKKILTILLILIIMFGIYMLFDYARNNINGGIISNTVNDINDATDITVRQNATNFINALELLVATQYASGNDTNINTIFSDVDSVDIRGTKPEEVELNILMGKVTDGIIKYENYIVKIVDGKVNEMIKE